MQRLMSAYDPKRTPLRAQALHGLYVDSDSASHLKCDHVTYINLVEPLNGGTDFNRPGLTAATSESDGPLEAINRSHRISDLDGGEVSCPLRRCLDPVLFGLGWIIHVHARLFF